MFNFESIDLTKLDLTLSDVIKATYQCPVKDSTQEFLFLKDILGEAGALAYYNGNVEAINAVNQRLSQKLHTMSSIGRQSMYREAFTAHLLKQVSAYGIPIDCKSLQKVCEDASKEYQEAYQILKKKSKVIGKDLTPEFVSSQVKFDGSATGLNPELNVVRKLLKHQQLLNYDRLRSSIKEDEAENARIFCTFESFAAVSGRIQSHDANVQGLSKSVREICFKPHPGKALILADYVGEELMLMAVLAQDDQLLMKIRNGVDLHSRVASKLFGKELSEITDIERRTSKRLTFACLYGSGNSGLQNIAIEMLGPTVHFAVSDIARVIKGEYTALQTIERKIKADRKITFVDGSQMPIEAIEKQHTIVNRCVQGSGSIVLKQVLIELMNELPAPAKVVCLIHDEVMLECPIEMVQKCKSILEDVMRNVLKNFNIDIELPIDLEIRTGGNYEI